VKSLEFDAIGFEDLAWWVEQDRKKAIKILKLIKEIQRTPFTGTGNPEQLRHDLSGCWSRRIDQAYHLSVSHNLTKCRQGQVILQTSHEAA